MTYYMIDKEGLLNLQRLYDAFAVEKSPIGTFPVKDLGLEFRPMQMNDKYRKVVVRLYREVFQAFDPESLQKIIFRSNSLLTKLVKEYGDFLGIPAFMEMDSLDRQALSSIADETVAL